MAIDSPITPLPSSEFRLFVERRSGQHILRCYQCGKCTAGCPAAYTMDIGPRRIMRAIQLGMKDEVLESSTIWLCLFCQTCYARCPREIDIPRVMESLRLLAATSGKRAAEKDIRLFHRIFLSLVQRWGRVHELTLGALYNLLSGHPLANATLLPRMLTRGKLSLLPPRVKWASEVKKVFDKVKAVEERAPL
ncbi:MAG: 4Fe-4S dicluster domain-containing protein [Dehalococcoidia bacterium]|nr:4Fe-4S dicluster domain-containing protein [Dehalococcoidia bacterium]